MPSFSRMASASSVEQVSPNAVKSTAHLFRTVRNENDGMGEFIAASDERSGSSLTLRSSEDAKKVNTLYNRRPRARRGQKHPVVLTITVSGRASLSSVVSFGFTAFAQRSMKRS